jgi:hypothetical protein
MLYGIGALDAWSFLGKINRVVLHIVQPRLDHIDRWEVDIQDLELFKQEAAQAARLALSSNAPRFPGDLQCKFCKAAATCEALAKHVIETVQGEFEDLTLPIKPREVQTLDNDLLSHFKNQTDLVRTWCTAIDLEVHNRVMDGQNVPGFKLVTGRSHRLWGDSEVAEIALEAVLDDDDLYTRKLISVAQAEKKIGKKAFADFQFLVVKPEGKPTVARDSDKRPAIDPTTDSGFDDLTNEQTKEAINQ